MAIKKNIIKTKKVDCKSCGGCCKHIAIDVGKPTSKEDYHYLMWYLLHENVHVSISHENEWLVEFLTPCTWLGENNRCNGYFDRPEICRGYDPEECVMNGAGPPDKQLFRTRDDLVKYLNKKKIDWQFKKHNLHKKMHMRTTKEGL